MRNVWRWPGWSLTCASKVSELSVSVQNEPMFFSRAVLRLVEEKL